MLHDVITLVRLIIYFGIGAICHALFVGDQFVWTSSWTIAWLFAWPIMLAFHFWFLVLCAIAAGLLIVFLIIFWNDIGRPWVRKWRRNRIIRNIGQRARS